MITSGLMNLQLSTCKLSRNIEKSIFLLALVLSACTTPASKSQTVNVYATSSAQPWLTKLYTCAENSATVLEVNADAPDIYLRVGEPDNLVSPAYQIDQEEILVVTHRESPIQNLTLSQTQDLFANGEPLGSAQVWVYSSDADLQMAFDQLVMKGRSVTSSAKIAVDPQKMSDLLNSESSAVGILPRHWKAGTVREVFSAGVVPVLAITNQEPQSVVKNLVSCLQNN